MWFRRHNGQFVQNAAAAFAETRLSFPNITDIKSIEDL
jgi:hypothetical protein